MLITVRNCDMMTSSSCRISSSGVVFVAVLARVVLGTTHSPAQWFGILLAAIGLGLVRRSCVRVLCVCVCVFVRVRARACGGPWRLFSFSNPPRAPPTLPPFSYLSIFHSRAVALWRRVNGVRLNVLKLSLATQVGAALLLEESRGHHNDTTTHIGIDAVGDYSDNNADGAVWG